MPVFTTSTTEEMQYIVPKLFQGILSRREKDR